MARDSLETSGYKERYPVAPSLPFSPTPVRYARMSLRECCGHSQSPSEGERREASQRTARGGTQRQTPCMRALRARMDGRRRDWRTGRVVPDGKPVSMPQPVGYNLELAPQFPWLLHDQSPTHTSGGHAFYPLSGRHANRLVRLSSSSPTSTPHPQPARAQPERPVAISIQEPPTRRELWDPGLAEPRPEGAMP